MQDQHQYKTTPDQGWAKMKPILEEAMPVSRPSRRFPFLWWTTTAVILTGVSSLLFLNGTTVLTEQASPLTTKTNSQVSDIQKNKDAKVITPTQPLNKTEADKEVQDAIHSAEGNGQSIKTAIQPPGLNVGKTLSKPKTQKKASQAIPLAIADPDNQKTETSSYQNEVAIASAPVTIEHEISQNNIAPLASVNTAQRNEQVVNPLASSGEMAFVAPDPLAIGIPAGTVTKAKRQPHFIEPSLVASGLIGQQAGRGVYGGAGINMNISRRFSIITDFGFLSYRPEGSFFGSTKSLDAAIANNAILNYDPSYPGNEIYVEADAISRATEYHEISTLVDKITQWQISAGLQWKFSRRFFASGGVQVGLHTQAYSTYPISAPDPLATPGVSFDNSLSDYNVIRSTTTSLFAGLGYRLGQHMDIFANWTHGLDQYILNDSKSSTADQLSADRTDYIRGLSLGLRYTL